MSDDKRIQRLTELAGRVWPDREDVVALTHVDGSASVVWRTILPSIRLDGVASDDRPMTTAIRIPPHARAIDALEAALLVLAGEDRHESTKRYAQAMQERAEAAERRLVDVEKLADWWERKATDLLERTRDYDTECEAAAETFQLCAAELRERAKEGR